MERNLITIPHSGAKKELVLHLLAALAGYILALCELFSRPAPFTAALIGTLSGIDCAAAFVGGAIGGLTSGDFVSSVPMMIACASVGVIRIFFGKSDRLAVRITSACVVAASVLLTNVITASAPSELLTAVLFAAVSGGSCYALGMIRSTFFAPNSDRDSALMKPSNLTAIGIVTAFAVAALGSLEVGIFNFGVIFSAIVVLCVSYKFRLSGSAAFAIISAFGLALVGEEYIYAGLFIGIGGVISGALSRYGKLLQAVAFVFGAASGAALLGFNEDMLKFVADILIGSGVYMALPVDALSRKLRTRKSRVNVSDPSEVFAERLSLVGSTMDELRYALEKTAETLDRATNRDISKVYNSACDEVCKNCRFNMKCWGEEYNDSIRAMNMLIKNLRGGRELASSDFSGKLAARCTKLDSLAAKINRNYADFKASEQTARKIAEMRLLLTTQLETTKRLFCEIAQEFSEVDGYDLAASLKAARVLERCGLENVKASVRALNGGVFAEGFGEGELAVSSEQLGDMMSDALQCELELPLIIPFGKKVRAVFSQRATFAVRTATCQFSRKKDKQSGDFIETYIDSKGFFYTILSDGMGSGARARIDSAFVCGMLVKLLESGVNVETAIELLNSSLLLKSGDESFATLDVCRVDLNSGHVDVFKAGGADTYFCSGKRLLKLDPGGLPVGVDYKPSFTVRSFNAAEDDIIIMTSDGADLSENWLLQTLNRKENSGLDELVKTIGAAAKFNCEKGREDDISVVGLKLEK